MNYNIEYTANEMKTKGLVKMFTIHKNGQDTIIYKYENEPFNLAKKVAQFTKLNYEIIF